MKKRAILFLTCVGILILAIAFGVIHEEESPSVINDTSISAPTPASTPKTVNYQAYNIDYINKNIKAKLVRQVGATGKTAFYLPSTGYINVSRGTAYGVAWLIQNVNPTIPEGNEFSFNFNAKETDCGVELDEAQGWIERGWTSTGMISGQWRQDYHEWYDAMTVYFAFPADIGPCNVKYDFVITKDGAAYDARVLEFNIL